MSKDVYNVEVYKKGKKWCMKIGDKKFCEGDKIGEYELRFGAVIIPDNEEYGDNLVVGFYLVRTSDKTAWHLEEVFRELTNGKKIEVYNGWEGKKDIVG